MFWRFGGYANVSAIDTILEKPEVTLEELLDESDLIQELKQHNSKLIEFLREDAILARLLDYVVAPKIEIPTPESAPGGEETGSPSDTKGKERSFSGSRDFGESDEEEREKKRNRYAYVSAEILSSDNWSICEALMENSSLLKKFWDFLRLPPPLDPLQASYFTKVNESLLDKKTEEMLDLFKSIEGAVKNMLQHVDSPMVMDLLLKIISLEKSEGGQGIVDWLHSQDLMPILLSFLSSEHSWATQTSAGDFLKAIITISANASQNEQSCIGPNELTRQLVSKPCIEKLISDMLKGGNPLTVGVGIVIEVIRKNNSDYDPEVTGDANTMPSSRDPIYLGTLLRMFAQRVPDFMDLILSPNHTIGGGDGPVTIKRKELDAAFGGKIEPLGFDRFKTCELMAELLHCSNMGLLNEIGSEEYVKARDAEREQLKSEGKLGQLVNQAMMSTEDLTMKSSTQTRLGSRSPEGSRKLEVQNASDDDGFEEVTHSADLGDDAKDDFDEKPEDILTPTNTVTPLSFMDKDEEEFVDEPLSSPRLATEPLEVAHPMEDPDMTVQPLSPTKVLSQQVDSLDLQDEDTAMNSPPPSVDSHIEDSEPSTSGSEKHTPESSEESADSPPRSKVADPLETEPAEIERNDISLEPLEGFPEDKPAPLFAKKSDSAEDIAPPPVPELPVAPEAPEVPPGGDSVDTTMGEAGDSSAVMGNTEENSRHSSAGDSPIVPVVGDFLKMQFVEHKVVPTILDFFFRFPWNNFLHNVVYDVVQQVFNGPMDRGFNRSLAIDLFETGDITMRIVDGQKKSDEAQETNKMRLGYMGHLTLIAEEVVKFTERHPAELLSESVLEKVMNGEWITYVEVTLAETRERDNAILGGVRPDVSVGPRQAVMNAVNAASNFNSGSSALAEAGLNGSANLDGLDLSNGNGTSAFTLSSGTLLSGFGSSSDEEDDEMDEDNEDDGMRNNSAAAEFSRYISTPSTTTSTTAQSDLIPPSAPPPPPPPLNIPPSRARRQLAARLALHSKQNSEMGTENGEQIESREHRKDLNPFATEEDDDEDSDEESRFEIGGGSSRKDRDLEREDEFDRMGNREFGGDGRGDEEDDDDVGLPCAPDVPPPVSVLNFGKSGSTGLSGGYKPFGFPSPLSVGNGGGARKGLSGLWPFGSGTGLGGRGYNSKGFEEEDEEIDELDGLSGDGIDDFEEGGLLGKGKREWNLRSASRNFGGVGFEKLSANDGGLQSDDSDDDAFADRGPPGVLGSGIAGETRSPGAVGPGVGKRRLSSTTEAKRRTSLEDDDEEEGVVHVGLGEGVEADIGGKVVETENGDGEGEEELVEVVKEAEGGQMESVQMESVTAAK